MRDWVCLQLNSGPPSSTVTFRVFIKQVTGDVEDHISTHLFERTVSNFFFLLGTMLADCVCHVAACFDGQSRSLNYGSGRGRATSMTMGSRVHLEIGVLYYT